MPPERRIGSWLARLGSDSVVFELVCVIGFLGLLWGSIATMLTHEYASDEAVAATTTGNIARAFEESTRRTVGQIDQTLLSARAFRLEQGEHFSFDSWLRTQTVADRLAAAIGMADASGHVFADTLPIPRGVSIADRAHFKVQRDSPGDELYISHPMKGRVSGEQIIQFTRKLLNADGSFAGVTVFSLDCSKLSAFYQTLELGHGFVALLSTAGVVLARGPMQPGMVNTSVAADPALHDALSLPEGTVRFRGMLSPTSQIASFRRLPDYPLVVMVGLDTGTALAPFTSLRRHLLLAGGVGSVVISLIGILWLAQKRRSIATREALTITLETIDQGVMMVDAHGDVPVVNPQALALLGVRPGSSMEPQAGAAARAMERMAHRAGPERPATRGRGRMEESRLFESTREDGKVIEVSSHLLPGGGFVHTYTNVTEQRMAEARLHYLAHHDVLTGVANRLQLLQHMAGIISRPLATSPHAALMMVDLDSFKDINDTLGHDVGDQLLIRVAERLRAAAGAHDVVARVGGDEFVLLLTDLREEGDAAVMAASVLRQLAEPIELGDQQLRVGASIGIALHPRDGRDGDTLFKHADIALYAAKISGRGSFRHFAKEMTQAVTERRLLENDFRRALEGEELEIYFQPLFLGATLGLAGFEALARWRHPTRGHVSPLTFIRIAEECGLIDRVGHYILRHACATAAQWRPRQRIAVNVSPLQLRSGVFHHDVAAILRETGLPPEMLEIEVTESVMADEKYGVVETLEALKAMGVSIALDDFGTGYSSLSYLRRFPFDKIKIDKAFIQGQATDQGVRVVLEAILTMCQRLGLRVVAEGVETHQQLDMLRQARCTELQGYLLGRPMAASRVEAFIRTSAGRPGGGPLQPEAFSGLMMSES